MAPLSFVVAAQVYKYDVNSYSKVSKYERVPIIVRIPPPKNTQMAPPCKVRHGSGFSSAQCTK
jgi:hypothetical protein